MYKLLEASLVENSLGIPTEQLNSLVDATFAEADTDKDGKISFEEYRVLVTKHPSMIGNMTITTNINKKWNFNCTIKTPLIVFLLFLLLLF